MNAKLELTGFDELLLQLHALPEAIENKWCKKAMAQGGKVIADAAKSLCPSETGILRRSIGVKAKVYKPSHTSVAIIGPRRGYSSADPSGKGVRVPTKYAHLVEFGHKVYPREAGALAATTRRLANKLRRRGNDAGYARAMAHLASMASGTVEPKPFLRPAFDQNQGAAMDAVAAILREGIAAEWGKAH